MEENESFLSKHIKGLVEGDRGGGLSTFWRLKGSFLKTSEVKEFTSLSVAL